MVVREELGRLLVKETKLSREEVDKLIEVPPDEKLGDYAFPCFVLARPLKKNPVQIARELAGHITLPSAFTKVEASGPYLNFFVNGAFVAQSVLSAVFKQKKKYGVRTSQKKTVMVEFFDANTHKGVHIGHLRNICLGESISRLLEAVGVNVIRVNYQGDIGPHVAKCIWGYLRFKEKEPARNKGVWLGHLYARAHQLAEGNDQFEKEIRDINKKLYAKDPELLKIWKKTRQWCLDDFDGFYKTFGVKFQRFYFESEVEAAGKKVVADLLQKKIAQEHDGAIIVNLKEYGLELYVAITRDGTPTYQAKEFGLGALKQKEYTFDESLHIVGMEQELFFRQVFKTYKLFGSVLASTSKHISYGLVMLPEGKMSSRDGTMILYDDLYEKIITLAEKEIRARHGTLGASELSTRAKMIAFGAMKYSMLSRENNKSFIFDWEQALRFEGDTGPYLQYAHARCASILGKAQEKASLKVDFGLFNEIEEVRLVKMLGQFGDVVAEAAATYHPHTLAHYLNELAHAFSDFYHRCPVISELEPVQKARLLLVVCVKQVLVNGLFILGIDAPDEM